MNKEILLTLLVALILGATGMRAATNYGINVAGVEVTSSNCNNVTGSKITGSVSYNPTSKILTLNNATISRSDGGDDYGIHNRSVDDLTIKIVGSCTVQCAKANALHLDKHTSISITSGSTLNAKMTAGENSGRGVIYVNNVTAYVTGSGTLNVTGTGKTSSYTIAGFEGKSKTGSSQVTLTNIKATINASGHGFYKCKSVTFGTQSDVKIHYSNGYALYETGAMYCNGTVKCVTPSEGTSFNSSSGYFVGGSTYSHFTDDWGVIVNSSNFPDDNFLGVMLGKCSSGEHYLTKSQHQNLTSLDCSSRSISSLTGINLLTYLTTLNCSYNKLTSLNVSSLTRLQTLRCNNNKLPYVYDLPASLQYLYCGGNQFTTWVVNDHSSLKTLDVSNTPTLTSLNCNNNALTSLTISGCTALNTISCDNNQFTSLPTLPSSLETLYCRGNKLTSLPTLPNSLKYLLCGGNSFTTLSLTGYTNLKQLDISNSTSLTTLNCYNNGLITLNVSGCSALSTLSCYNNYLTTLGTLPSSLKTIYCYTNNLNTLNVSGCTSLTYLDCKANYLTSLGTLPSLLQTINCSNNRLSGTLSITGRSALKTLNVSSNTGLTTIYCYGNGLTSLNVDGCSSLTYLYCYSNQLTSLGTLPNSLQTIDCHSNRLSGTISVTGRSALKTLDASSNTSLTTLNCYGNALTSLNVIGCSSLTTLDCHSNQLTSFQVLSSMQTINCSYNRLSGTISVTSRSALKTLDVSYNTGLTTLNCYSNGLTSLNVDGCSSLTTLDCNSNQLTSLPSLPNSLQTLKCGNNRLSGTLSLTGRSSLKTLDVSSNTDLNTLNCYSNALTSLSVVGCTALTTLNCYSNQLTSLGTLPSSLQTINCSSNRLSGTLSITGRSALKSLDVSNNTDLTKLDCSINALTTLNVDGCSSLTYLYCNNNQLTSLPSLPNSLQTLYCGNNQLAGTVDLRDRSALKVLSLSNNTSLNKLYCQVCALTDLMADGCSSLTTLDCQYNDLRTLNVSGCSSLTYLDCSNNQLTSLPNSLPTSLQSLYCGNNPLTSVDLTGRSALQRLNLSNTSSLTYLYCYNNSLTSLRVADCPALRHVACYGNQLAEDAMSRFVGDLPTIPTSEEAGRLLVLSSDDEGNVFTDSHKADASAKRWNALMSDGSPISSGKRGDINGDGNVDVNDVNIVINITLGKTQAGNYPGNADVTGDGNIDVTDVNTVINIVLGKVSDTPQPVTVTYDYMTEASLLAMGFADSELSPNISTFVYLESKQLSDQYATMDYRHFMLANLSNTNYDLYFCSVNDAVLQDWDVTGGQLVLTPKNGKKITKVVVESFSANAASRVAISGNSSCTTATDGALTTATFSGSGAGTVTISGEKSVINKISVTYQ